MKRLLLLRPEPGLSTSVMRARALGLDVVAAPLFALEPVAWSAPAPGDFDALLLTSANAVRLAGEGMKQFQGLGVHAVGEATADAARGAGFSVLSVGTGGAADCVATLPASLRLLHLCGEDRIALDRANLLAVEVYRAAPIARPRLPALVDMVIAVHSPRAAARLLELCSAERTASIAAISAAAGAACGDGWGEVAVAERPDDSALLALATRLCDSSP